MSDARDLRLIFGVRARQSHCRTVNFGVVATARVLGAALDERLDVRCECGAAGCSRRVAVTCREYGGGTGCAERVVVALGHEPAAKGRIAETNDRFAVVDLRADPGGSRLAAKEVP